MGVPKRKNSKQRSRKRRGSKRSKSLILNKNKINNIFVKSHHVSLESKFYKGIEVFKDQNS